MSTTDEIAEAKVLVTMMNGRIVHEEDVDWSPQIEYEEFDEFEFYQD